MKPGTRKSNLLACEDHAGLWADSLGPWLPEAIFDAHAHLCPPEAMGLISAERSREPLCAFGGFTWEEYSECWEGLFPGRRRGGLIAFPLPLREVDIVAANAYIRGLMKARPEVKGFLLAHPTDAAASRDEFERALADGVRYAGVKPYFDLLGKSNYETTMPEFIPEGLLELMDAEGLILMLHVSGDGMGCVEDQEYVRALVDRRPNIRIILAHMGRYLRVDDFLAFADTDLIRHTNIHLDMSSVTRREIYERALRIPEIQDRLLFGTDMPFGLIQGVEAWSEETGPVFVTRERFVWSCGIGEENLDVDVGELTHNTYHVVQAFKDAVEAVFSDPADVDRIKQKVFHDNAAALF